MLSHHFPFHRHECRVLMIRRNVTNRFIGETRDFPRKYGDRGAHFPDGPGLAHRTIRAKPL